MLTFLRRLLLTSATLVAVSSPAFAAGKPSPVLFTSLAHAAPELNPQALKGALNAMQCAVNNGAKPSRHLAIIDYSQPSTERRCGSST
jgi:hypothetical protein